MVKQHILSNRILIPALGLFVAITLLVLYSYSMNTDHADKTQSKTVKQIVLQRGPGIDPEEKKMPFEGQAALSGEGENYNSDVLIVLLVNGKDAPLALNVGGQTIKIPRPDSWQNPHNPQDGASDHNQYLAAIIDSADILRANGYRTDDEFNLVVGSTELNAGNTFRLKGNNHPITLRNTDEPAVEYHTQTGEQGIWRSLRFKNILLSHAVVPSLEDHIQLSKKIEDSGNQVVAHNINDELQNSSSTPHQSNNAQTLTFETDTKETVRKYVEALDSPEPEIRADAVQNLLANGYREVDPNAGNNMELLSIITTSLLDENPTVRASTLEALDSYEGNIPQATLSHIVLNDTNPGLRIQAMDLLVDRFGQQSAATLEEAIHDPDPRVGRVAKQFLDELIPQTSP